MGDPIPTFIQRRLRQLDAEGLECICAIRKGQGNALGLRNGHPVVLPRVSIKDAAISLKTVLSFLWRPRVAYRLWTCRPRSSFKRNLVWLINHFNLTKLRGIDLIHLQWIGMADDYRWLRHYYRCPIIASARGSQVTVYPHTSPAYLDKLLRCFDAVDYIHCVSEDIRIRCTELGASPTKLFINYNGVDLTFFTPPTLPRPTTGETQLISTGALIWRKGYVYQLLALKSLLQQGYNCRLNIIGDGPDLQGLQYTAFSLGISDQVTFHGALPAEKVRDLLQQAHIYLSTSAAEGLANSVLEAAACGLPVVAFDCEGMREVISDEKSGYIVPYGEIELFTSHIAQLISHQADAVRMGGAGRQLAASAFDSKIHVQHMYQQYRRICAPE